MVLRELLLKLGLEVDEAAFAKGQLAAGLIEAGLKKVVEVAGEVVSAFSENVKEAIEYGNRLQKTSQSIGIATSALQELQYAGRLADLSAEEMSQSIGLLSRKMQEAKNGSEETAKAFKGIAYKDGDKLKNTDEVLGSIADKFEKMPDGAEKTALAMQLFGRAGKQMIPLLNKGSEELDKMRQEARDLGLVLGDDAVKASEELNDNLERLHMVTKGIWRQAIEPLIPAINELVKRFLEWRKENGKLLAQKIQSFVKILIKGFNLLADVIDVVSAGLKSIHLFMPLILAGVTALTFAIIFMKREAIAAGIATAIAWLPITLLFVGIAAAVAAVLLLMEDFAVYQKGGKSLFGAFANSWNKWLEIKVDDTPFMRGLKTVLKMLGDAKQIIDDIGYALYGVQYFEDKQKRKKPEQFNEAGQYVGRQDVFIVPNTGGEQLGTRRRGEMSINGQKVRNAGSLTGQLDAGKYAKPMVPGVRSPEARTGGGGEGSVSATVHAPTQIGPIVQSPGENGPDFAQRVGGIVQDIFQGHVESAAAAVKR